MPVAHSPKGRGRGQYGNSQKPLYRGASPASGEIICSECDHTITHASQSPNEAIQVTPLANGGERLALICQFCKRQYPIAAISPNGVSARSRLQRLRRIGKGTSPQCRALEQRVQRETTRLATAQADETGERQ